eukprot:TRINITY_DN5065_c0_g2_i1.p1 TRINITY_DN5065_c0_g2~~TRINITY_DN5065_c0_g2_i1.p1  ORF type:complete len:483 (+),score=82.34 TRINITY_DN5065_c0_g2_i1:70-1449(+)
MDIFFSTKVTSLPESLEITEQDTVGKVLELLESAAGLDEGWLVMGFEGSDLERSQTLSAEGVTQGSEVSVTPSRKMMATKELEIRTAPKTSWGWEMAVRKGDMALFELYKNAETEMNCHISIYGFAAQCEQIEVFNMFPEEINHVSPNGMTVLMHAAMEASAEFIEKLIELGAVVNVKSKRGWTALMTAIQRNSQSIVAVLLEHGADPTLNSNNGKTAISLAAEGTNIEIFKMVTDSIRSTYDFNTQDNPIKWSLCMTAASSGKCETLQYLSDTLQCNLNLVNKQGMTALMIACKEQHDPCTEILLRQGADPNIQSKIGYTALMGYIKSHSEPGSSYDLLLFHPDLDLTLSSAGGQTALEMAIETPFFSSIHTLSVDKNPILSTGSTLLEKLHKLDTVKLAADKIGEDNETEKFFGMIFDEKEGGEEEEEEEKEEKDGTFTAQLAVGGLAVAVGCFLML